MAASTTSRIGPKLSRGFELQNRDEVSSIDEGLIGTFIVAEYTVVCPFCQDIDPRLNRRSQASSIGSEPNRSMWPSGSLTFISSAHG